MKLQVLIALLTAVLSLYLIPVRTHGQSISTVAGCGIGNDSLATKAELFAPVIVAFDHLGNAYIADIGNNMIRKVDLTGVTTTFAGTGDFNYTGDSGPATAATFGQISGLAFDKFGNLLAADNVYNTVRLINTSGIISTIAGFPTPGYSGDGFAATAAALNGPSDVATDTAGNIYIADMNNAVIRKINTAGIITTIAGNGGALTPVFGGPATASSIGYPTRITLDSAGNMFVGTITPFHIMKVNPAGVLTNVAGTGTDGFFGDGGPATAAEFSAPAGLVVDTSGNIYFSDVDAGRVRMINKASGIISTVIGTGTIGFAGDGGPAIAAQLSNPEGLSFDANHNLYIGELDNNRVRMVNTSGIISTFAGQNGLFGEDYPGVNAELGAPQNLASDAAGNIYIADIENQRVRMISAATGKIKTVAGGGISGFGDAYSGDGTQATAAHLHYPSAITLDASGNLFICDQDNNRIRKVDAVTGIISTIAGSGTRGYFGDGIAAADAEFNLPTGIAIDAAGNMYICDNNNQRIRKISAAGIITTFAGDGVAGFSGDGLPATLAKLNYPADVAVDAIGNVYISDQGNNRIRMIDSTGTINTIAGNGTAGDMGDGGPAISAELFFPLGMKVDNAGNIYFADNNNHRVRVVTSTGFIYTIAGLGSQGFSGDGGAAIAAQFNHPQGVAIDPSGNLFIADGGNHRVRKVNTSILSAATVKPGLPGVLVFPNPTKGIVHFVNAADCNVVINDAAGREVLRASFANANETIDISSLSNGVYIVDVTNKNGWGKTVKLVKE